MIALISDTHENENAILEAVAIIKKRRPDLAIHLGDIISPAMLDYFKGLNMKIIFGNNDGERAGLVKTALALGFEEPKEEMEFIHQGKKCCAYHGTDKNLLDWHIFHGGFDYVLTGHTHQRRDEKIKNTRVINPGALFRCHPYTIAFLDIGKNHLEFVEVPMG